MPCLYVPLVAVSLRTELAQVEEEEAARREEQGETGARLTLTFDTQEVEDAAWISFV